MKHEVPVSAALAAILDEDDIKVRVIGLSGSTMAPRETKAIRTLERMVTEHGTGHTRVVVALIVQSEGNASELVAANLQAVSRLVLAHPEVPISVLFAVMDETPLASVRRLVSRNVAACRVAEALITVLFLQLAKHLGLPGRQLDLFGLRQ